MSPPSATRKGLDLATSVGPVRADMSYGGAFYALVDAADLGVEILPENATTLTRLGMEIKRAVDREIEVVHPDEPELRGIYGTIISEPPRTADGDGRNITIYAEGAVDRSPCGTGTSAKLACLYADGRISRGQPYVHESVIGTTFTGRVLGETAVGSIPGGRNRDRRTRVPDRVSAVCGRSRGCDRGRVPGSMRRSVAW